LLLDKLARQRHSAAVEKPVSCRGVGQGVVQQVFEHIDAQQNI